MVHHAQLLIGDMYDALNRIPESDRIRGADVSIDEYDKFTIGDARALIEAAQQKPLTRNERIFVLVIRSFTHEAQNALLKLLEEPVPTARFYLIVPYEGILLPTLRSRLILLNDTFSNVSEQENDDAHRFLSGSYAERITFIATVLKRTDASWINSYLGGIEKVLRRRALRNEIRAYLFVKKRIDQNGASKKMLLEHLALSCEEQIR